MNIPRLVLGVLCGIAATGPMSVAMVLMHRRLPERERYPLPPREITMKAVEQIAGPGELGLRTRSALTWLAHFGYGGAAGALYAAVERRPAGKSAMRGPFFGLLVWAVSYLGLLPGLHVLTPATRHPMRRNALMIGSHLVWGWLLAAMHEVLSADLWRESPAFHASPRPHSDTESGAAKGGATKRLQGGL